ALMLWFRPFIAFSMIVTCSPVRYDRADSMVRRLLCSRSARLCSSYASCASGLSAGGVPVELRKSARSLCSATTVATSCRAWYSLSGERCHHVGQLADPPTGIDGGLILLPLLRAPCNRRVKLDLLPSLNFLPRALYFPLQCRIASRVNGQSAKF